VSRDHDHDPFRDDLSLAGWKLPLLQAKSEVFNYTHYEDMKSSSDAKWRNWGSWGLLKVIDNVTIR